MTLPTHCECCGVPLMGGATAHREGCAFLKLIREAFPGYHPPVAVGPADVPLDWVTADSLIEVFGDQAYHKGVAMTLEALNAGDRPACRALAKANIELIHRGFHKHLKRD